MADRATQVVNFYETTLSGLLASAGTSAIVATSPGVNASLGDEDTWFYLVIDPDNSGNREVVVVKTSSGTSLSLIERDLENDYAGSPPDHQSGTTVRMAVLAQHIDDQNDRVATNITSLDTAISDFESDGATAISNINASSATAMVNNATDGTAITVDSSADYILVYDATDSTTKKLYVNQLPFVTQAGASVGLVLALGG
jgi:hypothetical protein